MYSSGESRSDGQFMMGGNSFQMVGIAHDADEATTDCSCMTNIKRRLNAHDGELTDVQRLNINSTPV